MEAVRGKRKQILTADHIARLAPQPKRMEDGRWAQRINPIFLAEIGFDLALNGFELALNGFELGSNWL